MEEGVHLGLEGLGLDVLLELKVEEVGGIEALRAWMGGGVGCDRFA